jgi:ABC-2 type transport system permease protein
VEWGISHDINGGQIAVFLARPLDYQLFWLFNNLGGTLTNLVAITLPTVLLLTLVFKVMIPLGPGLALFPFSLLMAFLISYNIDYTVGLMAFYTESTWGLSMVKDFLVTVLAGALLPLQFFPATIQKVLLWLPFQAIYYTPLTMISQSDRSWETFLRMLAVQFAWVVVSFIFTRLFYWQAIKVLRVSGG